MIRILGIAIIAGVKMLLCKGIALGIFLLLVYIKGKRLNFDSDQWDEFFLRTSSKMVQRYAAAIYLIAASMSSVISYFVFMLAGYIHGLEMAILLFIGGLILTAHKWHTKGKESFLKRYQEIPKIILETHEQEEKSE